ncbi:MAG: TRAP transporter substrate-binding protein [Lachnospiraceae bacterium]|nr:TRAP transporter substrate-binding protein [Lachnospiraceae bacterium]
MKKKHIALILAAAVMVLAGIVIVIKTINKKPEPEYVFTYAENQSDGYPTSMGAYYFASLVEEKTNGRIKILVYTSGKLGREADVVTQMRYGGVDFARVSLSQLAEFSPALNVLQMPYIYNDAKHMWSVLDGEIGDYFLNLVSEVDLYGLSWYDAGARSFYNSLKPIRKLEDLEGLKIRVQQSDLMIDMVECLGATAVPLSYEEVYSALELGSIDAAENNWPSYEDTDHYKVAHYFCEDEHTRVPEMQICSIHTWNLLSDEDKAIIRECADASAEYERKVWNERVEKSRETAIDNGVVVTSLSKKEISRFREKVQPIYEKYCSEYMDILNKISEQ